MEKRKVHEITFPQSYIGDIVRHPLPKVRDPLPVFLITEISGAWNLPQLGPHVSQSVGQHAPDLVVELNHVEDGPGGEAVRGVIWAHGDGGEVELAQLHPLDGAGGRVFVPGTELEMFDNPENNVCLTCKRL